VFSLRFDKEDIEYWAHLYNGDSDDPIEKEIVPRIRSADFVTRPDFLKLCDWKSPRIRRHCEKNSEEFVEAVTRTAFSTTNEQLRIEVLTLLRGVSWPVASVILHFGCREPYPIMDFRVLWSLGVEAPKQYTFEFWWEYTKYCRQLADRCGVDLRTLDRGLWQYSKEHQK